MERKIFATFSILPSAGLPFFSLCELCFWPIDFFVTFFSTKLVVINQMKVSSAPSRLDICMGRKRRERERESAAKAATFAL